MATRVSNMPCLGTNIQGVRNKKIKHIEILDYKLNFILLWYTLIFLLIQLYYIMSKIKRIINNIFYTNSSIEFTLNKFLIVLTLIYRQKNNFFLNKINFARRFIWQQGFPVCHALALIYTGFEIKNKTYQNIE